MAYPATEKCGGNPDGEQNPTGKAQRTNGTEA